MKVEHATLSISGIRTKLTLHPGDGPVLICVHGNSLSRKIFEPLLQSPPLSKRFLITYDLPGHGESTWSEDPAASYTLRGYAEHLAALVRIVDVGPTVLLGISLGGHIAVQALSGGLIPRPAGLATVGSPPIASPADVFRAFLPLPGGVSLFNELIPRKEATKIAACLCSNPEVRRGLVNSILESDPRARSSLLQDIATTPLQNERAYLSSTRLPVLRCFGENDQVVNFAYLGEQNNEGVGGAPFFLLPGDAHLPDFSRADGFTARLSAFLDSLHG